MATLLRIEEFMALDFRIRVLNIYFDAAETEVGEESLTGILYVVATSSNDEFRLKDTCVDESWRYSWASRYLVDTPILLSRSPSPL